MKQMPGVCPGGMLAVGIDSHIAWYLFPNIKNITQMFQFQVSAFHILHGELVADCWSFNCTVFDFSLCNFEISNTIVLIRKRFASLPVTVQIAGGYIGSTSLPVTVQIASCSVFVVLHRRYYPPEFWKMVFGHNGCKFPGVG